MRGRWTSLARERDALLEPDVVTTEDDISTVHKSAMMVYEHNITVSPWMSELHFRRREELHEMNERIYTFKPLVKVGFIFEHTCINVTGHVTMTFTYMCVHARLLVWVPAPSQEGGRVCMVHFASMTCSAESPKVALGNKVGVNIIWKC